MLEAVPVAQHVEYGIVMLRGCWVTSEERFDGLFRQHLGMFRGGLLLFEQAKRELISRDDVLRLVLRGRGYLGHLRLEGVISGQNVATAHDVWLLLSRFTDRVNEMSPAMPSK